MKRTLFTLMGLLVILALVIGACAKETEAPTEEPMVEPTEEPMVEPTEEPAVEPTEEPEITGLYNGMTAEELQAAGWVVIAPGDPIRIGQSTGLTGPLPEPGLDIAQAAQVAIADLNEMGGYQGHEFELVTEDGACDGDAGTVVGNKFAADPSIVAVQGGMCTGETLALKPILQEARIPFVSASSTNPAVTSETCDVCNRVALSDKLQADVDADYIFNVLDVTTVAINTDLDGLEKVSADRKLHVGKSVTFGEDSRGFSEVAEYAAGLAKDDIVGCLKGHDIAFIVAGMGGGTGTGIAPLIGDMARKQGLVAFGIVVMPFTTEGPRRARANDGVAQLRLVTGLRPHRYSMSPPELAAYGPVSEVLQPGLVRLGVSVRDEAQAPVKQRFECQTGERIHRNVRPLDKTPAELLAYMLDRLLDGDIPLIRQVRFYRHVTAIAVSDLVDILPYIFEEVLGSKPFDDRFSRFEAVHAEQ